MLRKHQEEANLGSVFVAIPQQEGIWAGKIDKTICKYSATTATTVVRV